MNRIRGKAGNRQQVQIGALDPALTPNAGLAAVSELCVRLGVIESLDVAVGPIKAGRSQNSLVKALARQGADISPATLAGTCAQAGALLAPVAEAVTERSRGSWHLHADETTWRVFAPRDGTGPAKWWLWVFLGPDTVCFVIDPTRSGAVLARHAGIDEETGQLTADPDGGPRSLVISSDF